LPTICQHFDCVRKVLCEHQRNAGMGLANLLHIRVYTKKILFLALLKLCLMTLCLRICIFRHYQKFLIDIFVFDFTMMLLRSQSFLYFNVKRTTGLGLLERQPRRAVRSTAARNKHCEKLTSRRIRTCGLRISGGLFCGV